MHAAWTLLLARAPDSETATAAALAIARRRVRAVRRDRVGRRGGGGALPRAVGGLRARLLRHARARAALGPRLARLSALARVAPVLVLAVSVAVLGRRRERAAGGGRGGDRGRRAARRGLDGAASTRDTALALACGARIAGYTLTDSYGLRHAAPVPYLECVLVLTLLVYLPVMARLKGTQAIAAAVQPRIAVAALFIFGAYALVLAALQLAPAAPVAALRETSVVFATAYAALVLGEPAGRRRLARRRRRGGGDHGAGAGVMPTEVSPRCSRRTPSATAASSEIAPKETWSDSTPFSVQ